MRRIAGLLGSTSVPLATASNQRKTQKGAEDEDEDEEKSEENGDSEKDDEASNNSDEDEDSSHLVETILQDAKKVKAENAKMSRSESGRALKPQPSSAAVVSKRSQDNETKDEQLSDKSSDDDDDDDDDKPIQGGVGSHIVGGKWSVNSDESGDDDEGESVLLPVGYVAPPWLKASKKTKVSLLVGKARGKPNLPKTKSSRKTAAVLIPEESAEEVVPVPAAGSTSERATKVSKRPAADEASELLSEPNDLKKIKRGPDQPSSAASSVDVPSSVGPKVDSQEVAPHVNSSASAAAQKGAKNGNKRPRGKRGGSKHKK